MTDNLREPKTRLTKAEGFCLFACRDLPVGQHRSDCTRYVGKHRDPKIVTGPGWTDAASLSAYPGGAHRKGRHEGEPEQDEWRAIASRTLCWGWHCAEGEHRDGTGWYHPYHRVNR